MAEHGSARSDESHIESAKSQLEQDPIIIPPAATVYANHMALGMTVFDFALVFGEVAGVKEGRPVIQQRVKLLVAPLMAKIIAKSIAEGVETYEKQFGEIKEPEAGAIIEKS